MINEKKGHIFYWNRRDFEPLRGLIAFCVALGIIISLFLYLPLPFQQGSKQLKENRIEDLLKKSGKTKINYIRKDQLASLDPDSDFTLNDRFSLENHFQKKSEITGQRELIELKKTWEKERPSYEIQFSEIPYTYSVPEEKETIQPHLFHRDLPHELKVEGKILPPKLKLSKENSLPAFLSPPKIPYDSLSGALTQLRVDLQVSPTGKVNYAIPLDHTFSDRRILSWIKSLKFQPRDRTSHGTLTLSYE